MSDATETPKTWDKPLLLPTRIAFGPCPDTPTVGIDFIAADGSVFAHGHFTLEDAIKMHEVFGNAVATLRKATAQ